jgi:DNA-binding MarR family transcriptional regulator/N-acetylglutamate synthase-like GNAT family acetyltransferase
MATNMAARSRLSARVETVRRFNRFYTRQIGVLREGLLESPFSLTEARVLYELAHKEQTTARELVAELGLDAGYLSRILRSFQKKGLVNKSPSSVDGRRQDLRLTTRGAKAFARLNQASKSEIETMVRALDSSEQARLVAAMERIEVILGAAPKRGGAYLLRSHQPGDMGWVISRHGALYAKEYGWDERFEALVAGIAAKFINELDPQRERCWIAEKDGENVGCVFVVKKTKTVAQLRMLLVEPKARGLGIGHRLVDECLRFARERGYKKMMLWTNDILHAARRIYVEAGFELVREERHESFGYDLVGQFWEREL